MGDVDVLGDLYRHAVKFPGSTLPLAGLRTALAAVEEQLDHARAQAAVRLNARHNRDSDRHPDDRELDLLELKETVEQILPRVFRGGFVLALWSVFEVVSKRMANYVANQRGGEITASQWRKQGRETFLDIVERVYLKELGIQVFPDAAERNELDQLRNVRNALIHCNGNTEGLPESMRVGASEGYAAKGLDHFKDWRDEFVIPNAIFLRRNFALVDKILSYLDAQAYGAAHPTAVKNGKPKSA